MCNLDVVLRARPSPVSAVQNTHNGDQIAVAGSSYVVQSVVMQYKLVRSGTPLLAAVL
jgi:hypothetical protein